MKKLALAATLATLTTAVSAQNVEVYGKMRIYQERDEVGTTAAVTKQTQDGSRLGFRGTEDLGQGLKAFFTLETGIGADQPAATTMGDRTSIVGLSGSGWKVGLGRDKHQVTRVLDGLDALDNAYGTIVGSVHHPHGSRFSNAAFLTVTPAKDFNLHYQRSASETNGVKSAQAYGADAKFGPVSAGLARYDNGLDGANENSSTIVGGKVAVGSTGTTVFGIYSEDTLAGAKTEGKTVGVQQKLGGPVTVMATYGEKQGVDAYAVGATYALSKRTFLHARYRNEDAVLASADRRQFGIGIDHNF